MNEVYDYSTPETRVRTARFLLDYARGYRTEEDERWRLCYDYYNGRHRTQAEIAESCRDAGIPWIPAVSPDPYLQVETQISAEPPAFEFRGRDGDLDSVKAKQREFVTRYILDRSRVAENTAANDRRCLITGNCAWKVYWEGGEDGDIRVSPVDPRLLYPDPAAKRLDDCEFINYVYPLHRRALARAFRDDLKALGLDADTLARSRDIDFSESETYSAEDDLAAVVEHWYRDADGDICCSVQCGGQELRHIEKYWSRTDCNMYPFVLQYRVANPDSIWGRGDIEQILTLVDGVDRELSIAQLQSAYYGSDIILAEHDAFSEEPENRPGALWRLKPGAIDKVSRLGGLGNAENRLDMLKRLRELISETLGTLDIDKGISNTSLTSATALSQLIERSEARSVPKKKERISAFTRLYRLIDWSALEFEPEELCDERGYFPEVDTIIDTGDGMKKSNSFVLGAVETLLGHQITEENYPLVIYVLRLIDLDEAARMEEYYKTIFTDGDTGGSEEVSESAVRDFT